MTNYRKNLIFIIVFLTICMPFMHGSNIKKMQKIDFSIIGKAFKWGQHTLHQGNELCLDGKKFTLPLKVNELHCNAFTADFNNDDIPDYILSVDTLGNGIYFGSCDMYIFLSKNKTYQQLHFFTLVGGGVKKNNSSWYFYQILPNNKNIITNFKKEI